MAKVITPSAADRRPRGRGRGTGTTLVRSSLALVAVATVLGTVVGLGGRAVAATPTVEVGTDAAFGTIPTTGSGFALYTLTSDHNGQSTCHGSCAAAWPPLTVPAGTAATAGPGVTGTVGTSRQSDGTFQVTYNGAPLYTFVSDTGPGQVTGNGVADFFVVVVSPAATPTMAPAGTASTGAAPGALAFTGPGTGLARLFWLDLVLALLGGLLLSRRAPRRMRRTQ